MNEIPEGWVIRNLRTYGNSLVPSNLVEEYGIQRVEEMILRFHGIKIRIVKIVEPPTYDRMKGRMVRENDYWYKGEVVV